MPIGDPQDGFLYPTLTIMMDSYSLRTALRWTILQSFNSSHHLDIHLPSGFDYDLFVLPMSLKINFISAYQFYEKEHRQRGIFSITHIKRSLATSDH